ncbi:MAG TPA: Rrf2 family transcriptional regulator [Stellaceae bacterium]|nr:Rrf2 family transcriptional regulator [Stellaceae bacterium]
MSRATRFSVAVHALAMIERFAGDQRLNSEMIAGSVGTNASFVRRVLAMLSRAGLVRSSPGVAGAQLARGAGKITLLDVYRAVDMEDEHRLAVHDEPSQRCFIGRHIQGALDAAIGPAEAAFEAQLRRRTLADVIGYIAAQPQ